MAKKITDDDDFESDGEISDDIEELELKLSETVSYPDARRRLEQLREERELDRLINGGNFDGMF